MKVNKFKVKLCLDVKAIICVILKSSISHHNKSYDYENGNKYRQKQKNQ